jgi:hypothetical protein
VHTRENLYDAVVTIEGVDGSWRIANLDVIEESRIDPSAVPSPSLETGEPQAAENGR